MQQHFRASPETHVARDTGHGSQGPKQHGRRTGARRRARGYGQALQGVPCPDGCRSTRRGCAVDWSTVVGGRYVLRLAALAARGSRPAARGGTEQCWGAPAAAPSGTEEGVGPGRAGAGPGQGPPGGRPVLSPPPGRNARAPGPWPRVHPALRVPCDLSPYRLLLVRTMFLIGCEKGFKCIEGCLYYE